MKIRAISKFEGQFAFLSNFYQRSFRMSALTHLPRMGSLTAPSAEHAYQCSKMRSPDDAMTVLNAATPREAKRLGNKLTAQEGWERKKVYVMLHILRHKFDDDEMGARLRSTYPRMLVEGNTWGDEFWGCVPDEDGNLQGANALGSCLMVVRAELLAAVG